MVKLDSDYSLSAVANFFLPLTCLSILFDADLTRSVCGFHSLSGFSILPCFTAQSYISLGKVQPDRRLFPFGSQPLLLLAQLYFLLNQKARERTSVLGCDEMCCWVVLVEYSTVVGVWIIGRVLSDDTFPILNLFSYH